MSVITIDIPHIGSTRLLSQAERKSYAELAKESQQIAEMLEANDGAMQLAGVETWTATFRVPTFREWVTIRANAYDPEAGAQANALLQADALAAALCEGVEDCEGGWDALPYAWRSGLAMVVADAFQMSEDERRPLFGGPPTNPAT